MFRTTHDFPGRPNDAEHFRIAVWPGHAVPVPPVEVMAFEEISLPVSADGEEHSVIGVRVHGEWGSVELPGGIRYPGDSGPGSRRPNGPDCIH